MAKEKNLSRVTENESGVQGQYKNWFWNMLPMLF